MFSCWVKDTLEKAHNYDLILDVIGKCGVLLTFDSSDYFLQFNYTHILQEIYGIDEYRIHFIHGESYGNEDDKLIVGHGNDSRINEISDKIDELESKYNWTQRSKNEINECKCVHKFLLKTKKDIYACKRLCNYFYDSFASNIEIIRVYGLSLGEVDTPYLIDIKYRWPNAYWKFSFFSQEEQIRIDEIARTQLNLESNRYELFHFSNDNSVTLCNEIVKLNKIKEYESE